MTIINDNLVEGNEDFMIITPSVLFTITNSQTNVTIIDNNSEFDSIMWYIIIFYYFIVLVGFSNASFNAFEGNGNPTVCVQVFDGTPINDVLVYIRTNVTLSTAIGK